MDKPKTRDGVDFTLGMTLVGAGGVEIMTNAETMEVFLDVYTIQGDNREHRVWSIRSKMKMVHIPIASYYSSQQARVRDMIAELEAIKDEATVQVNALRRWLEEPTKETPSIPDLIVDVGHIRY